MKIVFDEHSTYCKCCEKKIFVMFNGNEFDYIIHNSCLTEGNYDFFVRQISILDKFKLSFSIFNSSTRVEKDLKDFRLEGKELVEYYPLVICRAKCNNNKYKYLIQEIPYLDIIEMKDRIDQSYDELKTELEGFKLYNTNDALKDLKDLYFNNIQFVSDFEIVKTQEHLIKLLKQRIKQSK